ncbi:hypothetical protein D9M68_328630 [compost metagenome]
MASKVQRFLVDRCGDDAADDAGFGVPHRPFDETKRGVTGNRAQLAPGKWRAFDRQVHDVRREIDVEAQGRSGRFERCKVAVDADRLAPLLCHFGECTNRNLRADAARVAHSYADDIAHESLRASARSQPGARRTYLMARR